MQRLATACAGVLPLSLVGCGGVERRSVLEVQSVSEDGITLIVTVGSCGGNPDVEAEETSDEVVLSARGGDTSDDCLDGASVVLDQPPRERRVIDAVTGDEVVVFRH